MVQNLALNCHLQQNVEPQKLDLKMSLKCQSAKCGKNKQFLSLSTKQKKLDLFLKAERFRMYKLRNWLVFGMSHLQRSHYSFHQILVTFYIDNLTKSTDLRNGIMPPAEFGYGSPRQGQGRGSEVSQVRLGLVSLS